MSIWGKTRTGLEIFRLSLGGALFGSAASGTLGAFESVGVSQSRDYWWALAGFVACVVILSRELRKNGTLHSPKPAAKTAGAEDRGSTKAA